MPTIEARIKTQAFLKRKKAEGKLPNFKLNQTYDVLLVKARELGYEDDEDVMQSWSFYETNRAFNGQARTYDVCVPKCKKEVSDFKAQLKGITPDLTALLYEVLKEMGPVKVSLKITADYDVKSETSTGKPYVAHLDSDVMLLQTREEVKPERLLSSINQKEREINYEIQYLAFREITRARLEVSQYIVRGEGLPDEEVMLGKEEEGKDGKANVDLVKQLQGLKSAVLDVKVCDSDTMKYAILAALQPIAKGKHPERNTHYERHLGSIRCEMGVENPDIFERENPNLALTIYKAYEKVKKTTTPCKLVYLSPYISERKHHIRLAVVGPRVLLIKNVNKLFKSGVKCPECQEWFPTPEPLGLHYREAHHPVRSSFIPLPDCIKNKRAVVNIRSDDNKSFLWCVLAAIHPAKHHKNRVRNYVPYENELNMSGLTFPMEVRDIDKFERQNPDYAINVYGLEVRRVRVKTWEKVDETTAMEESDFDGEEDADVTPASTSSEYQDRETIFPLRISKSMNTTPHKVLLLLVKNCPHLGCHFALIRNYSRLLAVGNNASHPCYRCQNSFTTQEALKNHEALCELQEPQRTECNETLCSKVSDIKRFKIPFCVYADFESLLKPEVESTSNSVIKHHEVSSYAYKIVCCLSDEYTRPSRVYRGPNAVQKFIKTLADDVTDIQSKLETKVLDWNAVPKAQRLIYKKAITCYICGGEFQAPNTVTGKTQTDRKWLKVPDHCHITGKLRGAAHSGCNLNQFWRKRFPVFLHNGKKYDFHFIVQALGEMEAKRYAAAPVKSKHVPLYSFEIIGENTELYKRIHVRKLKLDFLDSFQFLPDSLEKLASTLLHDDFKNVTAEFPEKEQHQLLYRKGVFPYSYMTSLKRLDERQLPPREAFRDEISCNEDISEEDYQHALRVWKSFHIQTLGEYQDLYNKLDVLLLADIFERFRDKALSSFQLDPAHYITLPAYAWDAAMKMANKSIFRDGKLGGVYSPSDMDQYLFLENGVRGGVSMTAKRYAVANNPELPETFDKNQPETYIKIYDINNLYGFSMAQRLPCSDYKFLEEPEMWTAQRISELPRNDKHGYVFQVDLDYPSHLHPLHNEYPLAPEHVIVPGDKSESLSANLGPKTGYIVHFWILQLYLKLGMVLTKVHRVLIFRQELWLKPYIEFNTNKRQKATNTFDKNFYKFMNNSVYGRTLMNVRRFKQFKVALTPKQYALEVRKPQFNSHKILAGGAILVEHRRVKVKLNRPVGVGQAILDISKELMYSLWYEELKPLFGNNIKLLLTDTDSFVVEILSADVQKKLDEKKKAFFDFSTFPEDHPLYDNSNRMVIGKLKDEMGGNIVEEFVGLRAKCYAYRIGKQETMKSKGVRRPVIKKELSFHTYKRVLFGEIPNKKVLVTYFHSRAHKVTTETSVKVALTSNDKKRIILEDRINTRAHFYVEPETNQCDSPEAIVIDNSDMEPRAQPEPHVQPDPQAQPGTSNYKPSIKSMSNSIRENPNFTPADAFYDSDSSDDVDDDEANGRSYRKRVRDTDGEGPEKKKAK